MPRRCFSCAPTTTRTAACRRAPALALVLAALCALFANEPVRAETFSAFRIDLGEVSRLYDTLHRDRITDVLVDSTVTYDWDRVQFGNQRYRVPTFLPTDHATTREVIDYTVIPGHRARFTVPRTYSFESTLRDVGDLTIAEPRDYAIPGLEVELVPMEDVAEEIRRRSLRQLWSESVRASVTSQVATTAATGGIKFEIPLPMPKSLESIFGPGDKTSITVRGREEITIAGETRVVKPFIGVEGRENQSLFPSLDMEQKLDVSLTGTIGDKVAIQVDHSSDAIGDNANRVRLAYTGYEDEVIQLIELGNTSLSLPGSQLVSVSTNAQGLFGVKALAKAGSTDITMIASKQEGEVSNATFSPTGGSLGQSETRVIRDVDYVKNKYFYFDSPTSFIGPRSAGIEVYRSVTQQDYIVDPSIQPLPGWVIPDPSGDGQTIRDAAARISAGSKPAVGMRGEFELLQLGVDYDFILNAATDSIIGVELFDPVPSTALKSIGVSYVNSFGQAVGGSFSSLFVTDPLTGGPVTPDSLMLEMIKAPDPKPVGDYASTWDLMIRYIYNLGLTNIDGNSLEVTIEDILNPRLNPAVPEGATVEYLRIFGLDQTDRTGTGPPDGRVDLSIGLVNLTSGILQFPSLEPFVPDTSQVTQWTAGEFQFRPPYDVQYDKSKRIYDEYLNPTQEQDVHQYLIKVSAVSTSKTFRINALNIVENSETITIGNERLVRNSDYEIDYETGEVTLKESALSRLTPDAKLNIEYQYKPLGGLGSSTLAGMSTVSKLGNNARLGTTLLYESKATSNDQPRLGEEPTRAIVGGVTASYQHQSRLLTDLANLLPFVDSDAPSTINLDGEIAGSLPNPNTKNEAYIDDFEGIEDTDRIGLARRSWYPASLPVVSGADTKPADSRLGFIWYNVEAERGLHRRDLNPELDDKENTLVQSLDIDLDAMPAADDSVSFAGVMLGFPGGGLDISQGQFIEIWVNDFKPDPIARGGKLRIDLGVLDENFFRPEVDEFNDEDKNRDGFAAAFDDTGLDGLFNTQGEPNEGATSANPDPSGDDLVLSRIDGRYSKVNGTEANLLYDTEDLDRNGQLTRDNAYFSYEIDLASAAEVDIRAQYPGYDGFSDPGHENDSWRLYRVKLSNATIVSPSGIQPRFDEIRHVRVWFDDVAEVVHDDATTGRRRLQIAEFSIEGNRWEIDGVRNLADSTVTGSGADFAIGVISTKTDPGVYRPPVVPNRQNEVSEKESSLALRYTNLPEGTQIRVLKRFLGQGQDLTLYRDLNFWVHTDSLRDGVEYYFRLGSNETNYYEVAIPFTAAYYNETGWSRVMINIADLTNLKFEPVADLVTGTARDVAEPDRVYPVSMKGVPSLQGVRFLYAGVRNRSNPNPQNGEVWVNDIYTGDVQRDFDHAARLSANVSLAGGALSVGGNWARTGADYRGLRQSRGSGADNSLLNFNAKTDLQYFLPLAGFSLPLSGSFSTTRSLPKYPPNSDTEIVDDALSDSLRTERRSRSFSTSLSRRNPSKNVVMKYTLDRIRPNFSYSDSKGISPSARDTTTNMSGSVSYQVNWAGDKTLPLLGKNRIRWWPNSLDFSSSATRQTGRSWSYRNGEFRRNPYQYSATLRNQGSIRYDPFRSLESSFGMFVNRDVGIPHDWHGVNVGREVGRGSNLRLSFQVPRTWIGIRLFEPSVEVQSNYNEDSSPNVRRPGDPVGTLNASASRNDTGRLRFEIGKHLATVFGWLGWKPESLDSPEPAVRPPGGDAGMGARAGVAAPPDSAASPADSTKVAGKRPGFGSAVRGIGRILVSLRPLNANIQHRQNSSYSRIPDRPDLAYQLGMDTNAGIEVDGKPVGKPDQRQENLSFNVDSGFKLGRQFDVQGRYARATTDNDFRANQSRSVNVTWPDVQVSWDGLGNFKPLRPIAQTGQVNVNYKETHQETGLRDQKPNTINDTFTLTPAIVLAWKNQLNTTFNVSYSQNSNETRGSKSTTNSLAVNLDLKRDFRGGGGMSFFGKEMKWNNTLETNLTISYSKNGGERSTLGGVEEPIPATTSFRVGPTVRYTFSRNVNGSAFIDYSRTFAEATDQTTTAVRLGVTAVIAF